MENQKKLKKLKCKDCKFFKKSGISVARSGYCTISGYLLGNNTVSCENFISRD